MEEKKPPRRPRILTWTSSSSQPQPLAQKPTPIDKPKRASLPQSKSMMNFSKSVFDMKNFTFWRGSESKPAKKSLLMSWTSTPKQFLAQTPIIIHRQKRASFPQSKSMMNFSKSVSDLRKEHSIDAQNKKNKKIDLLDPIEVKSKIPVTQIHEIYSNSYNESSIYLVPKPTAMLLIDFINAQLKSEGIDLTEEPYTDQSGFCGIPPALVQRYAEETGRDLYEVADALDHIRQASLVSKGRRGIPNDFLADSCLGLLLEQTDCENLAVWLTSLGLPMYYERLYSNGYTKLELVARMKESDILAVGISDKRHVRTLVRAISALNVTIQRISLSYEHTYESISCNNHSSPTIEKTQT